jgi:hypothetical protein
VAGQERQRCAIRARSRDFFSQLLRGPKKSFYTLGFSANGAADESKNKTPVEFQKRLTAIKSSGAASSALKFNES